MDILDLFKKGGLYLELDNSHEALEVLLILFPDKYIRKEELRHWDYILINNWDLSELIFSYEMNPGGISISPGKLNRAINLSKSKVEQFREGEIGIYCPSLTELGEFRTFMKETFNYKKKISGVKGRYFKYGFDINPNPKEMLLFSQKHFPKIHFLMSDFLEEKKEEEEDSNRYSMGKTLPKTASTIEFADFNSELLFPNAKNKFLINQEVLLRLVLKAKYQDRKRDKVNWHKLAFALLNRDEKIYLFSSTIDRIQKKFPLDCKDLIINPWFPGQLYWVKNKIDDDLHLLYASKDYRLFFKKLLYKDGETAQLVQSRFFKLATGIKLPNF